jgi:hypothetical protein
MVVTEETYVSGGEPASSAFCPLKLPPGPPILASDRHCFLTHLFYLYLASVSPVTSFWMRLVMVSLKSAEFLYNYRIFYI